MVLYCFSGGELYWHCHYSMSCNICNLELNICLWLFIAIRSPYLYIRCCSSHEYYLLWCCLKTKELHEILHVRAEMEIHKPFWYCIKFCRDGYFSYQRYYHHNNIISYTFCWGKIHWADAFWMSYWHIDNNHIKNLYEPCIQILHLQDIIIQSHHSYLHVSRKYRLLRPTRYVTYWTTKIISKTRYCNFFNSQMYDNFNFNKHK